MNFIRQLFTGIDNTTVDVARVLWVMGAVAFILFSAYEVYETGSFDMTNFSLAYSGLLACGAAGVKIKASTEPNAK